MRGTRDTFPGKHRRQAHPVDNLENVKVCLMEESLSLLYRVKDAESKVHR